MNIFNEYTTLTGMTLGEAMNAMKAVLPPGAYKEARITGTSLTDINPAFMTEAVTKIFGPAGIGWWYELTAPNVTSEEKQSRQGRTYTEYTASFDTLALYYAYIDNVGEMKVSRPILTNGSSDNEDPGFATRGAITNALGAAFAKLLWQIDVYKGQLDHNNAAAKYKQANGIKDEARQKSATTNNALPTPPEPPSLPPVGVEKPAVAPPVQEPVAQPPAPTQAPDAHDTNVRIDWAKRVVIPETISVPIRGKPFSDVIDNSRFGTSIIRFISGKHPNMSGELFVPTPGDEHQKMAQEAALILYDALNLAPAQK